MTPNEMLETFSGLDEIDQRGFIMYLIGRLEAGTFEKYFRDFLELGEKHNQSE